MPTRVVLLLITSCLMSAQSLAFADCIQSQWEHCFKVKLKKTASPLPLPVTHPGVSLEINGIMLGMSQKPVMDVLAAKKYKQYTRRNTVASYTYKDVSAQSQSFLYELDANGTIDSVTVYFGTPATGQTVIGISRAIQFFDNSNTEPTIKQVIAALDQKYGPVHVHSPTYDPSMYWLYGKNGLQKKCKTVGCPCQPAFGLPGGSLNPFSVAVPPKGQYVCLSARIQDSMSKNGYAHQLNLDLGDSAETVFTSMEAFKQLRAKAVSSYKEITKPKMPNL